MNQASSTSNFMRGFMSSAGSGLLMSGIFYAMTFAGSLVAPTLIHFSLMSVLPMAGIMIGAIGLFGGLMAMKRGTAQAHGGANPAAHGINREPALMEPVLVPAISAQPNMDRAQDNDLPPGSWQAKVGASSQQSRIAQILDNGKMSDKSRAAALLAEREAETTTQPQRG
jgi:hypothetical protein